VDIGLNTKLAFSQEESRIAYLSSLNYLTILPFLHINCIKFMGISPPQRYLAMKVSKDRFIGLHKTGMIQTWNILTGKFMSEYKANVDWQFEDYEEQYLIIN